MFTGALMNNFSGHENRVKSISSSQSLLISCGEDARTIIWNVWNGAQLAVILDQQALCCAISGHTKDPFIVIGGKVSTTGIKLIQFNAEQHYTDIPEVLISDAYFCHVPSHPSIYS
jgi:WD40 repeat protein